MTGMVSRRLFLRIVSNRYDHLVSVFGIFLLRFCLRAPLPVIMLQALDFQIQFLAEHLGACVSLAASVVTMVLQTKARHGYTPGDSTKPVVQAHILG